MRGGEEEGEICIGGARKGGGFRPTGESKTITEVRETAYQWRGLAHLISRAREAAGDVAA